MKEFTYQCPSFVFVVLNLTTVQPIGASQSLRLLILALNTESTYHISMDIVEEIKQAIQTLTDEQRRELEAWWHPGYDEWDLQMDSDARAGKLDALAEQALTDFRTGNCDDFP
ncbi:MAG: hypothetical protein NPIRA05_17330 [Nitrospirales bacterium]|nr:MAG: hypothetical protein NPIRA05_17330 [Nitrospirales bacterium]